MKVYSHSRLSCYEQCPHKFKLQYIDKVKTEVEESVEVFLGSRVHETLEKLYRDLDYQKLNTLDELLDFLRDEWSKNWNDSIKIVQREYGPENYLEMAEKYVIDYYNRYYPFNHGRTIAVEKRILIDLDGSGVIDYVFTLTGLPRQGMDVIRFMIIKHVPVCLPRSIFRITGSCRYTLLRSSIDIHTSKTSVWCGIF